MRFMGRMEWVCRKLLGGVWGLGGWESFLVILDLRWEMALKLDYGMTSGEFPGFV
jgi:hypothetical protein